MTKNIYTTRSRLHLFVGLIMFYHLNAPYLEIRIKSLQFSINLYFRKSIPLMIWNQALTELFENIQNESRHHRCYRVMTPANLHFKNRLECRGYMLYMLQPMDDDESSAATKLLLATEECKFDITILALDSG